MRAVSGEPAAGDIGFECGDSLFSRAIENVIQDGDHATPSHVFIVINPLQVFEAWFIARLQPLSKYAGYRLRGRVEIFRPSAPVAAKTRALDFICERYKDAPYGVPQIAGHLLVELARRAGVEITNPAQGGVVCHEVGVRYLQRLNFEAHMDGATTDCEWADSLVPEQINPEILRDLCRGIRCSQP